jgi:hypothetical protein
VRGFKGGLTELANVIGLIQGVSLLRLDYLQEVLILVQIAKIGLLNL